MRAEWSEQLWRSEVEARSAGTSVATAAETTRLECEGPRRECGDRMKSKPERVDYPGATTFEWISEIIYDARVDYPT